MNLILAAAWDSHGEHRAARAWLLQLSEFVTCPITELGFLRVSMSPAYSALFSDAADFLAAIQELDSCRRIDDNQSPRAIAPVTSYKDTTAAYLVLLAEKNGSRLATLDRGILNKKWAQGIAFNPLEG